MNGPLLPRKEGGDGTPVDEALDAFDISREPKPVRELYGPGTQSRQLLMARRLVERGVRYVQVYTQGGNPCDNHGELVKNLGDGIMAAYASAADAVAGAIAMQQAVDRDNRSHRVSLAVRLE